jgi:hypothetical protein
MPSEAPLRLVVKPGSYRCTWLIPGEDNGVIRLGGDLSLEPDGPPTGAFYGDVPFTWTDDRDGRSGNIPQHLPYSELRAELVNGLEVILIDVSANFAHDRGFVRGRLAIVGLPAVLTTSVYSSIELQISGLDVVAGIGPLKLSRFPAGPTYLSGTWSVDGEPNSTQVWVDEGMSLTFSFEGSFGIANPFAYEISFSPLVRLVASSPLSIDEWVENWIEPIRRIVCLATGRRERITYCSVSVEDSEVPTGRREAQVYGSMMHQRPYASDYSEILGVRPAFRLRPDNLSLLTLARGWQASASRHHPLLETYGSTMVTPEQHPRSRYLLLIQALEGHHGHENSARRGLQIERHAAKRSLFLSAVQYSLFKEARKFLEKYVAKEPFAGLDNCLRELFKMLPVDITPVLAATPIIVDVMANHEKRPQDVANALRVIRNDLSHGNRSYPDWQIKAAANLLERVARAHMLRLLGGGPEIQRRVLEES